MNLLVYFWCLQYAFVVSLSLVAAQSNPNDAFAEVSNLRNVRNRLILDSKYKLPFYECVYIFFFTVAKQW